MALGISTSGGSANVVAALEAARALGLQTIALTGRDGGAVGRAADDSRQRAVADRPRASRKSTGRCCT